MTGLFDNTKISKQEVIANRVVGHPNVLVDTTHNNQQVFDNLPSLIIDKFNQLADEASFAIQTTDNTKAMTNEEIERILSE